MHIRQSGHVRLWKYRVAAAKRKDFIRHYRADGSWVRLFEQAAGYLGTQLWADDADGETFYTADHWRDLAAFENFLRNFREQYEKLDAELDTLTLSETCLGAGNGISR